MPVLKRASGVPLSYGLRYVEALRPDRAVRPHVDLRDVAEDAALDDLDVAAETVAAGALVAHLRDHVVGLRGVEELVRLPDGAHERLLHVHVDAHLHRADGDGGVHVVGRRDGHRLDLELGLVVQHLAVVRVERHLGELLGEAGDLLRVLVVDGVDALVRVGVAPGDELGEAALDHGHPVGVALAHHADGGEADLLRGGGEADPGRAHGGDGAGALEEASSASGEHVVLFVCCFGNKLRTRSPSG